MSATTKHRYPDIHPVAVHLVDAMRPYCRRVELAGSLRRQRPMIGDIEICAIPIRPTDLFGLELEDRPTALDRFLDSHPLNFLKRGSKYQRFRFGRYEVDLFLPTQPTWGSIFTIRTGSADFSKWLVTGQAAGGAAPDNLVFRDGRLHAHGRLLHTPEESDVFAALGLAYIAPVERLGPLPDAPRREPVWNYE